MTVVIDNLSYAYPDADWAIQEISLRIERGQFLSIMGANGAGKSTLCLALNGIVPQATGGRIRGSVTVNSLDTKSTPVANLALQVGSVFQNPEAQLFSTNVETDIAFGLENSGLPRREMQARVDWAIELLDLSQLRHRSPSQLSGGERQRLAIAGVMAMSPRILVLDEPSANLDPTGKRELLSALYDLKETEGLTVIMAEHDAELIAEISDRIAVLDGGRLVDFDVPRRVFSDVSAMHGLGLGVPQISEIADCLNQNFDQDVALTTFKEAKNKLEALRESGQSEHR